MLSNEKGVWSIIKTPEQKVNNWVDEKLKSMSPEEYKRQYCCDFHLELPKCHVCSKPTDYFCKKIPSGGWGSIKCGRPTCLECECNCQDATL